MNRALSFPLATAAAAALFLLLAGTGAGADDPKEPAKAPPAPKKDDRPVSSDDAAKAAIERFERDFASKDLDKKMASIQVLAATRNDLVTKRLGTLLGHQDVDVRMAASAVLDQQYQNVALAGEFLRKAIGAEDEPEVLIAIAQSLGRIAYATAIPDMGEVALKNGNCYVKIEILKSFGKIKDTRALLPILDLWLVNPHGVKTGEAGEENYDSGAPGDHDAKEAERRYKEKHKTDGRRGAPPAMLKTYIQAIADACEKITGEKICTPTDLMVWMVKHEAELPYKLPGKVKQTLKEFQDRAAKKDKNKDKDKK
jgi:hypothetical protein